MQHASCCLYRATGCSVHSFPLLLWELPVTTSEAPAGTADPVGRLEGVRALAALLPGFMRMAQAHKSQLASEGRERAALVLLFPLRRLGPLRRGALAECVHSPPPTRSPHVATPLHP